MPDLSRVRGLHNSVRIQKYNAVQIAKVRDISQHRLYTRTVPSFPHKRERGGSCVSTQSCNTALPPPPPMSLSLSLCLVYAYMALYAEDGINKLLTTRCGRTLGVAKRKLQNARVHTYTHVHTCIYTHTHTHTHNLSPNYRESCQLRPPVFLFLIIMSTLVTSAEVISTLVTSAEVIMRLTEADRNFFAIHAQLINYPDVPDKTQHLFGATGHERDIVVWRGKLLRCQYHARDQ